MIGPTSGPLLPTSRRVVLGFDIFYILTFTYYYRSSPVHFDRSDVTNHQDLFQISSLAFGSRVWNVQHYCFPHSWPSQAISEKPLPRARDYGSQLGGSHGWETTLCCPRIPELQPFKGAHWYKQWVGHLRWLLGWLRHHPIRRPLGWEPSDPHTKETETVNQTSTSTETPSDVELQNNPGRNLCEVKSKFLIFS